MNTPASDSTSSDLLARAKRRDETAWLRLIEWIGPFILTWCRPFNLQTADREEVSQEVLMRVWHALADFRKEKPGDSFRAWVRTITKNCCRNFLNRQRRQHELDRPREQPAPSEVEADHRDAEDMKRRALLLLVRDLLVRHGADRGFRAFYRTRVDGLPTAEAARELGLSEAAVRQHRCRWTARLREQLHDAFEHLLD